MCNSMPVRTNRLLVFVLCPPTFHTSEAQGLTGQISGAVRDPAAQSVLAAKVTLLNRSTRQISQPSLTSKENTCSRRCCPAVLVYGSNRQISELSNKKVSPSRQRDVVLPTVALVLGQFNDMVTVETVPTALETQSSDRSGLVDSRQMQELSLKGRDYLGTLKLLPGILDTASATREAPGNRALIGLFVNGNRQGTLNLSLDGISTLSLGGGTGPFLQASIDAVEQVKVLQTNYQAEYGRSVGGTINTVTKSGTRRFPWRRILLLPQ